MGMGEDLGKNVGMAWESQVLIYLMPKISISRNSVSTYLKYIGKIQEERYGIF